MDLPFAPSYAKAGAVEVKRIGRIEGHCERVQLTLLIGRDLPFECIWIWNMQYIRGDEENVLDQCLPLEYPSILEELLVLEVEG